MSLEFVSDAAEPNGLVIRDGLVASERLRRDLPGDGPARCTTGPDGRHIELDGFTLSQGMVRQVAWHACVVVPGHLSDVIVIDLYALAAHCKHIVREIPAGSEQAGVLEGRGLVRGPRLVPG